MRSPAEAGGSRCGVSARVSPDRLPEEPSARCGRRAHLSPHLPTCLPTLSRPRCGRQHCVFTPCVHNSTRGELLCIPLCSATPAVCRGLVCTRCSEYTHPDPGCIHTTGTIPRPLANYGQLRTDVHTRTPTHTHTATVGHSVGRRRSTRAGGSRAAAHSSRRLRARY